MIGSFTIKWYGICYLIAFLVSYYLLIIKANKRSYNNFNDQNDCVFNKEQITDLLFYSSIGVIIGGRVGYILIYSPEDLLHNPLTLIQFWLPGRSFHGGLLGVLVAILIYARKYQRNFLEIANFIAPIVPVGIGCGRIGNFINGELYGRVTNVPWGMIFPHVDQFPRHPSQIYEFLLEGVLLFLVLNLSNLCIKDGSCNHKWIVFVNKLNQNKSGLFLIFYGVIRFFVEYYREPDFNQNFIIHMTMGQILSIPMILAGIVILFLQFKNTDSRL